VSDPADHLAANFRSLGQRSRMLDGRKCRVNNFYRRADGAWQSGDDVECRGVPRTVTGVQQSTKYCGVQSLAMNTSVDHGRDLVTADTIRNVEPSEHCVQLAKNDFSLVLQFSVWFQFYKTRCHAIARMTA